MISVKGEAGRKANMENTYIKVKNDDSDVKLRKYENALSVCGIAVIMFSFWDVIKVVFYTILNVQGYRDMLLVDAKDHETLVLVVLFVFVAIDCFLRVYVGRSAGAYASGKREKTLLYMILAFIFFISYVVSIASEALYIYIGYQVLESILSIIIEITAFINMIQLTVYTLKIRKIRKSLSAEIGG